MEVHGVDKSLRKVQFQRHIKRSLGLKGFFPVHGRAEDLAPIGAESLVAKAFGTIERILAVGGPHLIEGGRAYILKTEKDESVEVPGFRLDKAVPYHLTRLGARYKLFIYVKTGG